MRMRRKKEFLFETTGGPVWAPEGSITLRLLSRAYGQPVRIREHRCVNLCGRCYCDMRIYEEKERSRCVN